MKGLRIQRRTDGRGVIRRAEGVVSARLYCGGSGEPPLEIDGLGDFDLFFSPVLERLESLHWFVSGASFTTPEEWDRVFDETQDRYRGPELDELDGHIYAEIGTGVFLARPGFLPKYSRYLIDDWCEIIGLEGPVDDVGGFTASYGRETSYEERIAALEPAASACFFCIDGVYWEFFSVDAHLVDTVRDWVETLPEVEAWPRSLADKQV